jgi:hypothetical protein
MYTLTRDSSSLYYVSVTIEGQEGGMTDGWIYVARQS